jgi:uncharacterized protein with NRDE domain
MSVWQNSVQDEFLRLQPCASGANVLVLIDDKPRSRSDRSFLYKLLVQRRNLKSRFENSEILVFLALEGRVEDLMMKYAGWNAFLEAVHQVGFGVFVLRHNSVMYYPLAASTYTISQGKMETKWTTRDSLTNSIAEELLSSIGDIRHV